MGTGEAFSAISIFFFKQVPLYLVLCCALKWNKFLTKLLVLGVKENLFGGNHDMVGCLYMFVTCERDP